METQAEWKDADGNPRTIELMEARYLRDYYRKETESLLSSHLRPSLDRMEQNGGADSHTRDKAYADLGDSIFGWSSWMTFEQLCRIVARLERAEVAMLTGRQLQEVAS